MKYLLLGVSLTLLSLTANANEKDSALTNYNRTVQLGIVNNQHNSQGVSIAYTHKVRPNKINRYSLNIHHYNNTSYYQTVWQSNNDQIYKNITEVTYTASFGQQFYKNVFRNLDINCGYDFAAGYSNLEDYRRKVRNGVPSPTTFNDYTLNKYYGFVLRITPYVGTVIHLSNRWFLSGEFSMQSPRLSVHFGNTTAADFNLYFLNSSFRVGFKF